MSAGRALLPRLNPFEPPTQDVIFQLRESLQKYGAIRVSANKLDCKNVFSEAKAFFEESENIKKSTIGYSPLLSENVRKDPIPKQTLYDYNLKKDLNGLRSPPKTLRDSVEVLHQVRLLRRSQGAKSDAKLKNYSPFRSALLSVYFSILQVKNFDVNQYRTDSRDTLGIHLYESQRLRDHDTHFNPPHIDSGFFTLLFQEPGDNSELLQIANLGSTNKVGSEAIGQETDLFQSISLENGEAILLVGRETQRIFGDDLARACVHQILFFALLLLGNCNTAYHSILDLSVEPTSRH
ncbi:hypothetical protein N7448_011291 [Penicillium atrosanguineum]|nr:hypothetical protein N7448_011291 [Penicillium atrosanguineum]